MASEFERCLRYRKIIKFPGTKDRVGVEIKAAKDDLQDARDFLKSKKYKYATVAGYYSIFHSARSLLYSRGYRERSHFCLRIAIHYLFVKEKLLESGYLEIFDESLGLREAADYQSLFSKEGAKKSVKGAREFLAAALEILV